MKRCTAHVCVRAFGACAFVVLIALGPLLGWCWPAEKTLASTPWPPFDGRACLAGRWMKDLERHLQEASPLCTQIRGVYVETLYRLGLFESPRVRFGRDGWMFLREDPRTAPARDQRIAFLRALHERFQRHDAELFVLPVPDKERVYADKCFPAGMLPEPRAQNYKELLADLETAQIRGVDLARRFAELRAARPGEALFHMHDTHWSGAGIGRAAQTVREELARLGWLDRLGAEEVLEPIVRRYELAGDLTMVCGIRAKSALARELSVQNETFAVARPGGGGICAPEQKDAMVALAGTSFSDYGLRQVLPLALKRRVDSVCVRPGSRPFESILELLHRIERGEIHPRLVVWESHERSLAVETWDEALSALGPN